MASLRIKSGPRAGETVEITGDLTVGRQNADLTIDDAELSRRHAVVRVLPGGLEVEDLGSSNGTFVDGRRIEEPTAVGGGAQLKLGVSVLEVEGVLPPKGDATAISGEATGGAETAIAGGRDETRAWNVQAESTLRRPTPPAVTRAQARAAGAPAAPQQQGPAAPAPAAARPDAPAGSPPASGSPASGSPAAGPPAAGPPAGGAPAGRSPVGEFRPPARKRRARLASRSWVPVALSFGSVVLTAIALVIYFAAR